MHEQPDELVASLVDRSQFLHHLNEVASVTTRHIVFLERKFVSRSGYDLVERSIDGCIRVRHSADRSILLVISGALLVGLVASVLYLLGANWDRLDAGMRIPVGALALGGLYGLRWLFGARRHRLAFTFTDGTRVEWRSRPGEYRGLIPMTERVVEFARSRGILDTSLSR